jgi:hypothetical protein
VPNLPLTVPYDLWEKVAAVTSPEYADSYLSGAEVHEGRLLPRTQMAWERLKESWPVREVFRQEQITLIKPPPFDPMKNVQLARAA